MKPALAGAAGAAAGVLALAWWAGVADDNGAATQAAAPAPMQTPPAAVAVPMPAPVAHTGPAPAAGHAPVAPALVAALVPVLLTGPDRLQVGEQAELSLAVGAHASVGEVAVTIRFDPNVLQVRAGSPGAWTTGDGRDTRFTVAMSEAADVVQLRAAPGSTPTGTAAGTVALVQFEAVGPGTTAVVLAEVVVSDRSGRALPALLSMSQLQVTAEAATTAR